MRDMKSSAGKGIRCRPLLLLFSSSVRFGRKTWKVKFSRQELSKSVRVPGRNRQMGGHTVPKIWPPAMGLDPLAVRRQRRERQETTGDGAGDSAAAVPLWCWWAPGGPCSALSKVGDAKKRCCARAPDRARPQGTVSVSGCNYQISPTFQVKPLDLVWSRGQRNAPSAWFLVAPMP
jgi:hypothetical protein